MKLLRFLLQIWPELPLFILSFLFQLVSWGNIPHVITLILGITMLVLRVIIFTFKPTDARHRYVIPKGKHYSIHRPTFRLFQDKYKFAITFREDSKYVNDNPQRTNQINKGMGLSYSLNPHTNSMRLGWRYNEPKDSFELFAYYYMNKVRFSEYLGDIKVDQSVFCELGYDRKTNFYFIKITDEKTSSVLWNKSYWFMATDNRPGHYGSYLFPYFGGQGPGSEAPTRMTVEAQFISTNI